METTCTAASPDYVTRRCVETSPHGAIHTDCDGNRFTTTEETK